MLEWWDGLDRSSANSALIRNNKMAPGRSKTKRVAEVPAALYPAKQVLAYKANSGISLLLTSEEVSADATEVKGQCLLTTAKAGRYRLGTNSVVPVEDVVQLVASKTVGKGIEVDAADIPKSGSDQEDEEEDQPTAPPAKPSKAKTPAAKPAKGKKAAPAETKEAETSPATRISPRKPRALPTYKDYSSSDEDKPKPRKRKNVSDDEASLSDSSTHGKKSKAKCKAKPTTKRPKLREVPDITENEEVESAAKTLDVRCCVSCNDRNVLRAAVTQSLPLLKAVIQSEEVISSLNKMRGPDMDFSGLYYALLGGNKVFIKTYLDEMERPKRKEAFRLVPALTYVGTGHVSHEAYGAQVRRVNMSRGGREGNNALLHSEYTEADFGDVLKKVITRGIEPAHVDLLISLSAEADGHFASSVGIAVRTGHVPLALHLIHIYNKKGGFGFNALHEAVLRKEKLPDFKKVSATKKVYGNYCIAPLHCACINPNPAHLRSLLDETEDSGYADTDGWKAVHYAAVCISNAPMKLLLDRGAHVDEITKKKVTPLMIAASRNRAETAQLLLAKGANIDLKSRRGKTALCYAAKHNSLETIKVLLAHASKKTVELPGLNRMTALIVASTMGHIEAVRLLLEAKASVKKKDKFSRTALLQAVQNGHADVAALLLRHGADVSQPDSSKNTPLHYACAYGWWQCVELLLSCQADVNAVNDWKLPPLLVALLKGHTGLVKRLLEVPGVDVNFKDEEGCTLLSRCISVLSAATLVQMEDLLKHRNADPNLADLKGLTPLHHLAELSPPKPSDSLEYAEQEKWVEEQLQFREQAGELLLVHGADWRAVTEQHESALYLALQARNYRISRLFIAKEAVHVQKTKSGSTLLHAAAAIDPQQFPIVRALLDIQGLRDDINAVNDDGFTPFLSFCYQFAKKASELRREIKKKLSKLMLEEAKSAPLKQKNEFQASLAGQFKKQASDSDAESDETEYEENSYKVDKEELESRTSVKFEEIAVEFGELMEQMVTSGCDSKAFVQKLMKYRTDPQLIKAEYEESKTREQALDGAYEDMDDEEETRALSALFITDYDGSTRWNEYNEHGLKGALHFLLDYPMKVVLEKMLSLPLALDQRNFSGDTALHVSAEKARNYVSLLLSKGADPNIKNCKGQTPLHIACVQESAEAVSSLLSAGSKAEEMDTDGFFPLQLAVQNKDSNSVRVLLEQGANPNFCDGKKRTALHHAFNSADVTADASFEIESLLLEAGADINKTDVRLRSPLHYAFVKIGNPDIDSAIDPVETVSSACNMKGVQPNLKDAWQRTALHYAAQRGAVTSAMILIETGADVFLRDEVGNSALGIALAHGHAAFATMLLQHKPDITLPVVVSPKIKDVLNQKKRREESEDSFDDESHRSNEESEASEELSVGTYSTFRAAIKQNWLGVAYLLLYRGYDYMRAMQDALSEKKFQLCLTLLAKVTDSAVLRQSNEVQENLFHTLAKYGSKANIEITTKLGSRLHLRKVDFRQGDMKGCQPVHIAAGSQYPALIRFLLNLGADIHAVDAEGKSAVVHAIEGKKVETALETLEALENANFNIAFKNEEGLMVTPIIHAVMQSADKDIVLFLLNHKADITARDGRGRNLLVHAIKKNNVQLVEAILDFEGLDLTCVDDKGWSYVHHAVCPLDLGSYENVEILKLLANAKVELTKPDNEDHTPFYYACKQQSGTMKAALKKLKAAGTPAAPDIEEEFHPASSVDYHSDFEAYLKEKAESMEIEECRKPDPAGRFPLSYEVLDDFDVLMVRVDLAYGPYSAYLFYRMQLLRDKNRDVFVVFTRWGRIGETGAFQRTPFSNRIEGEAEFKKIFKEKTKNEWGVPFFHVKGKYRLLAFQQKHIEHKQFLQFFDLVKAPPSHVSEPVQKVLKQWTDSGIYANVFESAGINLNVLNFANLGRSDLAQAQAILCEIGTFIEEMKGADTNRLLEIKETLYDLSSRFYEIIPVTSYLHSAVVPMQRDYELKEKMELLESLRNVEIASKIVLGALHRQDTLNPYDYCYMSLKTEIVPLNAEDAESKLVRLYAENGGNSRKIVNLFRVRREEEGERIHQHDTVQNRMLLWHGSAVTNFLGILTQGLKIAPPEAPATGYMFGKGLYFADHFAKSFSYCSAAPKTNYFILLAEVVLGKSLEKFEADYITKLPNGYLSLKGIGREGPDMPQSVVLDSGIRVPCGPLKKFEAPEDVYVSLSFNEYIVYDVSQVRIRYMVELTD